MHGAFLSDTPIRHINHVEETIMEGKAWITLIKAVHGQIRCGRRGTRRITVARSSGPVCMTMRMYSPWGVSQVAEARHPHIHEPIAHGSVERALRVIKMHLAWRATMPIGLRDEPGRQK